MQHFQKYNKNLIAFKLLEMSWMRLVEQYFHGNREPRFGNATCYPPETEHWFIWSSFRNRAQEDVLRLVKLTSEASLFPRLIQAQKYFPETLHSLLLYLKQSDFLLSGLQLQIMYRMWRSILLWSFCTTSFLGSKHFFFFFFATVMERNRFLSSVYLQIFCFF